MYTQRKTTLLRWHFEFGAISISPPVCSLPVRFLSMQDIAASSWVATISVAWSNCHLAGWAIDQQNHASIIFNPLPYKKSNIFHMSKITILSKLGDTHTQKKRKPLSSLGQLWTLMAQLGTNGAAHTVEFRRFESYDSSSPSTKIQGTGDRLPGWPLIGPCTQHFHCCPLALFPGTWWCKAESEIKSLGNQAWLAGKSFSFLGMHRSSDVPKRWIN